MDGLPKQYRNWLRGALKVQSVPDGGDASGGGLKQDDYSCRLLDGPWFRGWSACGATKKYIVIILVI